MAATATKKSLFHRERENSQIGESTANQAKGASKWGVLTILIILTVYAVGPLWWLIVSVTKNKQELYTTNGLSLIHI